MINRHIRHDWQTFVDWEQKSVRTVCGVTTRRHLAGIPFITVQEPIVAVNGQQRYGWCVRCSTRVLKVCAESLTADVNGDVQLHPTIRGLYNQVLTEMHEIMTVWDKYKRNLPPA
jgi:hypothetical protein